MATKTQTVKRSTTFSLDPNTWSKPGYLFLGWNTYKEATTALYTDAQDIVGGFDDNATLYAIWKLNLHTVTFVINQGGRFSGTEDQTVLTKTYSNNELLGDLPTFENVSSEWGGRTPDGWWTEDVSGTRVNSSTPVTSDVTYYAHWYGVTTIRTVGTGVTITNNASTGYQNVASGFNSGGYLESTDRLNFSNDFEVVICGTTTNNAADLTPNQEIFGMTNKAEYPGGVTYSELEMGIMSGKIMWELQRANPKTYNGFPVSTNQTWYWKGVGRHLSNGKTKVDGYVSTDGVNWSKCDSSSDVVTINSYFDLGYDADVTDEWWRGTINLDRSYVNIYGCKFNFILAIRIVFDANEGAFSGGETQYISDSAPDTAITLPTATRTEYTLTGWYMDSVTETSDNKAGNAGESYTPPRSMTLYAHWTPVTHRVTLNKQGGAGGSDYVDVIYGQSMPPITLPSMSGHHFIGYFTFSDGGIKYYNDDGTSARNWDSPITGDILYAGWNLNRYNISYSLDGGSHGTDHPTLANQNEAYRISAPNKTGYTFTGWTVTSGLNTSTAKYGTSSSSQPTSITSSSQKCLNGETGDIWIYALSATHNSTVTLTANWQESWPSYPMGGGGLSYYRDSTSNNLYKYLYGDKNNGTSITSPATYITTGPGTYRITLKHPLTFHTGDSLYHNAGMILTFGDQPGVQWSSKSKTPAPAVYPTNPDWVPSAGADITIDCDVALDGNLSVRAYLVHEDDCKGQGVTWDDIIIKRIS